jgi:hypothetical protein
LNEMVVAGIPFRCLQSRCWTARTRNVSIS